MAGLRFWARRSDHHLARGSLLEDTACKDRTAGSATQPLSSPQVEQRPTRIAAETDRYRITGVVRLPPEGYRSRLSDYLNTPDSSFLALTDVELTALDGNGTVEHHKFLALSLRHIVFAVPLD